MFPFPYRLPKPAFEQMDNRVDPNTAWVELAASTDIPLSAIETLAAAQAACLIVGAFPDPAPVPAELLADNQPAFVEFLSFLYRSTDKRGNRSRGTLSH